MSHATAIGLDVHARSIAAVALSRDTGEVAAKTFGYDPASVAEWILSFEDPKAVYESGVTGFHLVRAHRALGVDCVVGAVSTMQRPAADRRRKNDRGDAEFLARQLLAHNVVEVFVPDEGTEGARCLSRALEDIREDLTRAKHRLTHLLIRWGHVWNELTPEGRRKGTWTRAHWEWIRSIDLPDACAQEALDYYVSEVRHIESQKKALEGRIARHAAEERWRGRVEALRCLTNPENIAIKSPRQRNAAVTFTINILFVQNRFTNSIKSISFSFSIICLSLLFSSIAYLLNFVYLEFWLTNSGTISFIIFTLTSASESLAFSFNSSTFSLTDA